jgi:hypothetical protein
LATTAIAAKFLLYVPVAIANALAVLRLVLPVVSGIVNVDWTIDGEVVAAPVGATAPIIST